MFRPMRRAKKAIPDEAAKRLLQTERRGVLAVNGDLGYPYAVPVNFLYDEAAGKLYFHGARAGHKADALRRDERVCFTVCGAERVEPEAPWAPYLQSAVVFGRCRLMEDGPEAEAALRRLAAKYYPDAETIVLPLADGGEGTAAALVNGLGGHFVPCRVRGALAVQVFEITVEHLSGKQIQEK